MRFCARLLTGFSLASAVSTALLLETLTLQVMIAVGVILLLALVTTLSMFVNAIRGEWREPVQLGCGLGVLASLLIAPILARHQVSLTKDRGDMLIQGLMLYQDINGEYPSYIEQLVPDCLDAIPKCATGVWLPNDWYYNPSGPTVHFFSPGMGHWLRTPHSEWKAR